MLLQFDIWIRRWLYQEGRFTHYCSRRSSSTQEVYALHVLRLEENHLRTGHKLQSCKSCHGIVVCRCPLDPTRWSFQVNICEAEVLLAVLPFISGSPAEQDTSTTTVFGWPHRHQFRGSENCLLQLLVMCELCAGVQRVRLEKARKRALALAAAQDLMTLLLRFRFTMARLTSLIRA